MMKSENIFDIWRFLGKGTPFIVRRNGWYHRSYMVTRVIPKGQYGEVYGYMLTDGKPENSNTKEILIDCCGCGNWELIENQIDDVSSLKWNCLDENNNLTFGKYKGKNAEEVERLDKNYYNWALGYVGGFQEQLFCRKYHISPEELAKIKKKIKSKLSFTSDDWIKSTINNNFDFVLDQCKYAYFTNKSDIRSVVNKLENYYRENTK